ncbi:MAG TPA: hypothetical protein VHO69_19490 [Phototrophicaceae bacterium]|nr:hypothetical protein [Phototrophicaceae bacterium]
MIKRPHLQPKRLWFYFALGLVLLFGFGVQSPTATLAQATPRGLQIALAGTDRAYFTHNGKPLLSFGGQSDKIFYDADDAYNYRQWADWAAAHGMNHVRAYPPPKLAAYRRFGQDQWRLSQ